MTVRGVCVCDSQLTVNSDADFVLLDPDTLQPRGACKTSLSCSLSLARSVCAYVCMCACVRVCVCVCVC